MKTRTLSLFLLLAGCLLFCTTALHAATEPEKKPQPQTTEDPAIPVYELKLMLKPFTKEELLIEADGWQALVRQLAVKIANEEIAVKRQNLEIDKAQEVQEQAREAAENLKKVTEVTREAEKSGDAEVLADAKKAAKKARKKIEKVQQTVSEAAEAADKTAEVLTDISAETVQNFQDTAKAADKAQDAVEKVGDEINDVTGKDVSEVREAARKGNQASTEASRAITDLSGKARKTATSLAADNTQALMKNTARVMEAAEEAKQSQKIDLLEDMTHLRDQRVRLLDKMRAVVDELARKTDPDDSKTQARIQDYRLYMQSVRGLNLDASDLTSLRIAILGWMGSKQGGLRWVWNIFLFSSILLASWFLAKLMSFFLSKGLGRFEVPQLLAQFLIVGIRWLVCIAGFIIALSAIQVSVGPVLALLGAAGFIVAFALQDSLSNFASGLMILFFRPFDVNDLVEAGGVSGRVTSMNLVATTIRTVDNKVMIVPNNSIFRNVITNSTSVNRRRVDLTFSISYQDDIDKAMAVLEDITEQHDLVLKNPEPKIKVAELGDYSVNIICRPWTRSSNYWDVYWDITREVKMRFDREGISIPYPRQDISLVPGSEQAGAKQPGRS